MQVMTPGQVADGLFDTMDVQGVGRSGPRAFTSVLFDFQFMRWLAQAAHSGAEIGECFSTAHLIENDNTESWLREWQRTAERVEGIARSCLDKGHRVSAREAFLRATNYYGASFFYTSDSDPRKRELYARHQQVFRSAGELFDTPFEAVDIPYGDKTLPGYFLRPDGSGAPRPTVMIITGGDGTNEWLYFFGGAAAALRRGYNVLVFSGPGQTGAYLLDSALTMRHDWEVPTGAVIDYLQTRAEVDTDHIAYIGFSMGGYFVPRAAAFDSRIAACVTSCLVPELYPAVAATAELDKLVDQQGPVDDGMLTPKQRYGLDELLPRFGFRNGVEDVADWAELVQKMTLWGLADQIRCPVLNISASGEGKVMYDNAMSFFTALGNPQNRFVFTNEDDGAEMHCQLGNSSLMHQIAFDWLDEVFDRT